MSGTSWSLLQGPWDMNGTGTWDTEPESHKLSESTLQGISVCGGLRL